MVKSMRIAVLSLIAIMASDVMGQEYSYEFTAKTYDAAGTKTLNEVDWTLNTDAGYFGYDGTKGQQIGSAGKPGKTITLTTSGIKGTVKSVVVGTAGASSINATLTVSVGGTPFGSPYSLTTSVEEARFNGEAMGEIKLEYAQTSSKAVYIKSIKVIYEGGEMPEPPMPTISEVKSIAELNALSDGTEVTLYLSDDMNARVTFVYGDSAFLRDKTGAACFYGFEKNPLMAYNQHIAGYITGKKTIIGNMPAFTSTERTNTSMLLIADPVTEENVEPKEITAVQMAQNYADWVVVKDVTMQDETIGNDATGQIKVTDIFKADKYLTPQAGTHYIIAGIVYSKDYMDTSLCPVYNAAVKRIGNPDMDMSAEFLPITIVTGIDSLQIPITQDTIVYDLMGRRVNPAQMRKGIYIVNGKKYMK